MKRVLFLISLITFVTSCSKQQKFLSMFEVNGNVKSIRTTVYKAVEKFGEVIQGDIISDEEMNKLITFDENGNIKEISIFNKNGDLEKKSIYVYGVDNKVLRINKYDGYGNENGKTVYSYNEYGKEIEIIDYDRIGKVNYTQKNEWEGDKIIKNQFINEYSDGKYNINEYDGNTLVKTVTYDKSGKKTGEYIEYENEKIKRLVNPDFAISLSYNDKGICSSIVNGRLYDLNTYIWSGGNSYVFEYEYDENGNWIRKVEKQKDSQKAERIFVREIEYY